MKAINERKNRNGNILLSDGTSLGANRGIGYEEMGGVINRLLTGMREWRNVHFSQNPFGSLGEITEDQLDEMLNPPERKKDNTNETDAMRADNCLSAKSPSDDEIDEMLNPSKKKNETDETSENDIIKAELQTTVSLDYSAIIDSSSYDQSKVTIDLLFDELDRKPNGATNMATTDLMSSDDSDESIIDLTND